MYWCRQGLSFMGLSRAQQADVNRLVTMSKSLELKRPRVISYRKSTAPVVYGFQL